jgi:hypothetical protein
LQLPSASADDGRIPLAANMGVSGVQPPLALHDRSLLAEQSAQDRTWLAGTFSSGHPMGLQSYLYYQFLGLVELSKGDLFY